MSDIFATVARSIRKPNPRPAAPPPATPSPTRNSIRGAGDVVHRVAQPIARALDRVLGTKIEHCGGCAQRRETLNRALPFKSPPPPPS
jgi:hypothetical protein